MQKDNAAGTSDGVEKVNDDGNEWIHKKCRKWATSQRCAVQKHVFVLAYGNAL